MVKALNVKVQFSVSTFYDKTCMIKNNYDDVTRNIVINKYTYMNHKSSNLSTIYQQLAKKLINGHHNHGYIITTFLIK